MAGNSNKEEVFELIQQHPEGLDDDDICAITGIRPRQQVQQLCSRLAANKRIRRESVEKPGKRRKIHNFPIGIAEAGNFLNNELLGTAAWRRRLSALVAATGQQEPDLLQEALSLLAMKVLKDGPGAELRGSGI